MCLCLKRSLPHHIVLYIGGIKLSGYLSVCLSVKVYKKVGVVEVVRRMAADHELFYLRSFSGLLKLHQ